MYDPNTENKRRCYYNLPGQQTGKGPHGHIFSPQERAKYFMDALAEA